MAFVDMIEEYLSLFYNRTVVGITEIGSSLMENMQHLKVCKHDSERHRCKSIRKLYMYVNEVAEYIAPLAIGDGGGATHVCA